MEYLHTAPLGVMCDVGKIHLPEFIQMREKCAEYGIFPPDEEHKVVRAADSSAEYLAQHIPIRLDRLLAVARKGRLMAHALEERLDLFCRQEQFIIIEIGRKILFQIEQVAVCPRAGKSQPAKFRADGVVQQVALVARVGMERERIALQVQGDGIVQRLPVPEFTSQLLRRKIGAVAHSEKVCPVCDGRIGRRLEHRIPLFAAARCEHERGNRNGK